MTTTLDLATAQSAIINCTTNKQLIRRYIRATHAVVDPSVTLIGGGWVHVRKLPAHDSYLIVVCRGNEQELACYGVLECDEFDALLSNMSNLNPGDLAYPCALADAAFAAVGAEWSRDGEVKHADDLNGDDSGYGVESRFN